VEQNRLLIIILHEWILQGCSNNNFNSKTKAASKVHNNHNKDPIVKLGSFVHNSLNYCAYLSSPWPCIIIPIKVMGNCPRPNIILLHTCNLGNTIFAWSILSWIMHKNSSFNHTSFVLQVWNKFLHDFWCKICFLSFASYSRTSLLLFPNLDIKSFKDSQTIHVVNTNPCFGTSTFKWCLFLNLLIVDREIPPMFNSLLIYHPTNTKKQRNIRLSTIDIYLDIYIQKCISIFLKIIIHKKHMATIRRLSPNRNKKCRSFHIIYLIIAFT
jgi:hypothetical protein